MRISVTFVDVSSVVIQALGEAGIRIDRRPVETDERFLSRVRAAVDGYAASVRRCRDDDWTMRHL